MLSEQLIDHFQNPRNVGMLAAPAVTVEASNPVCGDVLRLSARFDGEQIAEVRFQTRGCTASIAAGSALTELLLGKTRGAAGQISTADVEASVGGLSNESKHAAQLCIQAVRLLLAS